jgi:hypothetical protein
LVCGIEGVAFTAKAVEDSLFGVYSFQSGSHDAV